MGKIVRLSTELVNQIAAGEVVERPASILKELVENAIDAGATRIEVQLEAGGKGLVRVVDDGGGIPADDLPLAVASHATSKLPGGLEDLFCVRTLGFRGEALASMGSVADLRIVSRPTAEPHGAEIRVRAGDVAPVRPAAAAPGTVVEVRDLFANVPARRKFLRDDAVELKHCVEAATRLALGAPGVAFDVGHEGRRIFTSAAVPDPVARVGDLFGHDLARDLVPVSHARGAARVRGLVSLPHRTRADTTLQYTLLEGRPIRDKVVASAIKEAYDGFLMVRRAPLVFLWITLPPGQVDVNVHPAKLEVRFRESREVFGAVRTAIREALEASTRAPGPAAAARPANGTGPTIIVTGAASDPAPSIAPRSAPPPAPSLFAAPRMPIAGRCFQLLSGYLIADGDAGFEVIDPHALHERILYEEIKARVLGGAVEVQSLLVPTIIDLDPAAEAALPQAQEPLAALGLVVEPFGPRTAAVHAVPALLPRGRDVATLVLDLIASCAASTEKRLSREALLDSVLATLACKAAIKLGDPLSDEEIASLLARRTLADRSHLCPHGRPTALRFGTSDLERQFKR